jgi:hypothetical protein
MEIFTLLHLVIEKMLLLAVSWTSYRAKKRCTLYFQSVAENKNWAENANFDVIKAGFCKGAGQGILPFKSPNSPARRQVNKWLSSS